MTRLAFVIPGDITLPTGGYAYDRRVLAQLGGHGVDATHVALPGSYPAPTQADLDETVRILAGVPKDTVLLIDGLAFGAMPADTVARIDQKIVALVHHPLALETGLPPMRARFLQQCEQLALTFAEQVVVPSPMTGRILTADFGVDAAKISVAEPGTDRAHRAKGTGSPLQLLAVGSIVPRKGYAVLASALHAIASRDDWHLTIVGAVRDETAKQALDAALTLNAGTGRRLSARVTITGAVDDATLDALYGASDIFVMPSLYEGYGMVLAEALARGLPIISTSGVPAARMLPPEAVRIVDVGSSQQLGTALKALLESPSLRRRMSDASWEAGQHLPTWDDTARIIANTIKRVSPVTPTSMSSTS